MIAVQPTRGLDIGAIDGIHKSLFKQTAKNRGVLLISFELDKVFKISDHNLYRIRASGRVSNPAFFQSCTGRKWFPCDPLRRLYRRKPQNRRCLLLCNTASDGWFRRCSQI
ncbi:hypothetical protein D3Z62_22970 [Lachnospiraceae bacterium]|nr:hypothetical protein [Lachnospiraceae bacterium]